LSKHEPRYIPGRPLTLSASRRAIRFPSRAPPTVVHPQTLRGGGSSSYSTSSSSSRVGSRRRQEPMDRQQTANGRATTRRTRLTSIPESNSGSGIAPGPIIQSRPGQLRGKSEVFRSGGGGGGGLSKRAGGGGVREGAVDGKTAEEAGSTIPPFRTIHRCLGRWAAQGSSFIPGRLERRRVRGGARHESVKRRELL
jgi:hypothetical protein